jgi:Patatin-like phospholipase
MARRIFLHLYMMRVPLLLLVTLGFGLPPAFRSPMLHGLADLEDNQIAVLALGAFLLLCATMSCCFLVLLYGTARADGKREPPAPGASLVALPLRLPASGWIVGGLYLFGAWCLLRFLFAVERTLVSTRSTTAGLSLHFWEQAGLGVLIGTLLILAVFFLDMWISDPKAAPEIEVFALPIVFLLRQWDWLSKILKAVSDARPLRALKLDGVVSHCNRLNLFWVWISGPGYGAFDADGKPRELYPGHAFAGILAVACIGLYFVAGTGVHHKLAVDAPFGPPRIYDAVLLQVTLLLLLSCWVLAAFAFYFDRFRIPVLIPIFLILFGTSYLGPSDHSFHTISRTTGTATSLLRPAEKFASAQDHVIAVAAAGGGIQAAAWTSQVLCGLRQELGPAFDQSVLVISGVSGGSVGTMFYLRCLESPAGDLFGAEAARKSSLEAVAWGLAHPDLRHAVLPLDWLSWSGADRGWALERALRKNAQFSPMDRPLASVEVQQKWPVVLLNSTEVRTGDPIVFTNSNFPQAPDPKECAPSLASGNVDLQSKCNHRLHGFHTVYSGRDVLLETAVRMSAAFPYVSPASRADTPWSAEHLVDGGYFDNSGLFTLTEWIKEAAPDLSAPQNPGSPPPARKKILILRVDAFPDGNWTGPADQPHKWGYQFLAPLYAILHVRSEGQLVRDGTEGADLLEILNRRGHDASALTVRYIPENYASTPAGPVSCATDPPLTWHLTKIEQLCIEKNWEDMKGDLLVKVNAFLASPAAKPTGSPAKVLNEPVRKGLSLQSIAKQ